MKNCMRMLCIALLLYGCLARKTVKTAGDIEVPAYLCRPARNPITIDGILQRKEWRIVAAEIPEIYDTREKKPAPLQTKIYTLYGDHSLYIAFDCEDRNIVNPVREHDGDLWNYDVVEIFIDPDSRGRQYMELELSPYNILYDSQVDFEKGKDIDFVKAKAWNSSSIKTAARIWKDSEGNVTGWSGEIAIPYTEFRTAEKNLPPSPGDTWRINYYRINRSADTDEDKPVFWAWSPTLSWFHVPERFGIIRFVK